MFRPLFRKQAALLLATSLSTVLISGCANFTNTAAPSFEPTPAGTVSGMVYGGSQTITGTNMTLWAAGNSGYGTGAVSLATTTVQPNGSFTFGSYSCPTTGASQMTYLTGQGGVTGGQANNTNIFLMAALGDCATIKAASAHVLMDEATTIAAMAALHNFATLASAGGVTVGAPTSNITGLTNAFATANNLVPSTGSLAGQGTLSTASAPVAGFSTNPTIVITPETAKSNLEANILAACVQTASMCATLFTDVSSTAAVDTLQAAYDMQTNITSTVSGTSNIGALFALSTASSPFQAAQSTQPTDWTLGITYGSNSGNSNSQYFMSGPEYLAIDSTGNVWFANYISGTVATNNSVSEISPAGVPLKQVLVGQIVGPAAIVIDPSNNVWVTNYGTTGALQTSVTEYVSASGATNTFTVDKGAQGTASDGAGNIFTISPSYKGAGALDEITAGSASGSTATQLATGLTTDFTNLAIDSNATVWITGGGTGPQAGTTGYPYVYQFLYTAGNTPHYATTPNATTNIGGITAPESAIAIDHNNYVWVVNYSAATIASFGGTTSVAANTGAAYTATGLTTPEFGVFDGAGSFWVTNTVASAGSVFGYSTTGASLVPSVGLAHTYKKTYGIAVDPSGNIWVGNYSATSTSTVDAFITEIVGGAVPVVTPIAAGLPVVPGGTNKLATRP